MKILKFIYSFSFLFLFVFDLCAEYVIFRTEVGKLGSIGFPCFDKFDTSDVKIHWLENFRYRKYKQGYDIFLKYQFPMCSNPLNEISEQDWQKIGADQERSEENFLRGKIKSINSKLDIFFIPSTIIDLFLTNLFFFNYNFQTGMFEIPPTISKEELSGQVWVRGKEEEGAKLIEPTTFSKIVSELYWNSKREGFRKKLENISIDISACIKENNVPGIWRLFFDANKFDAVSKTNFFVDSVIVDYCQKHGINIFELKENFEKFKSFFMETVQFLSKNIQKIAKEKIFSLYEETIRKSKVGYLLHSEEDLFIKDEDIELLKRSVDVEIDTHKENKFLLYRGSSPFQTVLNNLVIIDSVLKKYPYYDLSYGNSILAGKVEDPGSAGAEAYSFIKEEKVGYLLKVKKQKNNDLFFISPLNPICSFFASGEFFHSRSKIALPDKTIFLKEIHGIETCKGLKDQPITESTPKEQIILKGIALWDVKISNLGDFLLSGTSDPYRFDSLLSDYIASHAIIIKNKSGVRDSVLLDNQGGYSRKIVSLKEEERIIFEKIRGLVQRIKDLEEANESLEDNLEYEKGLVQSYKEAQEITGISREKEIARLQKELREKEEVMTKQSEKIKFLNESLTKAKEELSKLKGLSF